MVLKGGALRDTSHNKALVYVFPFKRVALLAKGYRFYCRWLERGLGVYYSPMLYGLEGDTTSNCPDPYITSCPKPHKSKSVQPPM